MIFYSQGLQDVVDKFKTPVYEKFQSQPPVTESFVNPEPEPFGSGLDSRATRLGFLGKLDRGSLNNIQAPYVPPAKPSWEQMKQEATNVTNEFENRKFTPLGGQLLNMIPNDNVKKISSVMFPETTNRENASNFFGGGTIKTVREIEQILSPIANKMIPGVKRRTQLVADIKGQLAGVFEDTYNKNLNIMGQLTPDDQNNIVRVAEAMDFVPKTLIDLPSWDMLTLGTELEPNVMAQYLPNKRDITLGNEVFKQPYSKAEQTLMHEITHAAQEVMPLGDYFKPTGGNGNILDYLMNAGRWPLPHGSTQLPDGTLAGPYSHFKDIRSKDYPKWPKEPGNPANWSHYANTHPVEDIAETGANDLLKGTPYQVGNLGITGDGYMGSNELYRRFNKDPRSTAIQELFDILGVKPWESRW